MSIGGKPVKSNSMGLSRYASSPVTSTGAILSKNPDNNADSNNDDNPSGYVEVSDADGNKETVAMLTDTIDLPQFAWLNLNANTKEQELTFQNPPQNFASFRVSILLHDRTILWKSDIIPPGETSEKVVLSKALPAGSYPDSVLKYECYQDTEGSAPLNGAENKLTLKVY